MPCVSRRARMTRMRITVKVLHINASSRGENSQSLAVARRLIAELAKSKPIAVDELDLFDCNLPPFDAAAVGAKMALFTGTEADSEQKRAWAKVKAVFDRFAAADLYVFNVPLWNNGIPYILKQFIDIVTQPGWAFGFDPASGYCGLLPNRRACIVHASGVYHGGIAANFGSDFATPYLEDWLRFIGVEAIDHIHVAPTVVNADFAKTKAEAEATAEALARTLAA